MAFSDDCGMTGSPSRTAVIVAVSLPPGITAAQFSALVRCCVERRLSELLGPVNCAVVTSSC